MGGKVETIERIVVIASSPDIEGEVLLGIPAVPTSSGANQVGGILPLIEKYEIADHILSTLTVLLVTLGDGLDLLLCFRNKLILPMCGLYVVTIL